MLLRVVSAMSSRPQCPHCGKYDGLTGCSGDCVKQNTPINLEECKVVDIKIDHEAITLAMEHRIEALEAALTEAHRVILHELDNGRTPYRLPVDNGGKGLGYFEDVLAGVER